MKAILRIVMVFGFMYPSANVYSSEGKIVIENERDLYPAEREALLKAGQDLLDQIAEVGVKVEKGEILSVDGAARAELLSRLRDALVVERRTNTNVGDHPERACASFNIIAEGVPIYFPSTGASSTYIPLEMEYQKFCAGVKTPRKVTKTSLTYPVSDGICALTNSVSRGISFDSYGNPTVYDVFSSMDVYREIRGDEIEYNTPEQQAGLKCYPYYAGGVVKHKRPYKKSFMCPNLQIRDFIEYFEGTLTNTSQDCISEDRRLPGLMLFTAGDNVKPEVNPSLANLGPMELQNLVCSPTAPMNYWVLRRSTSGPDKSECLPFRFFY